ncbi:hypothetical protein K491DRAFT_321654 [Lophiostoma macrostomum CBS 122681]|uniref:Rhodopsin domain-containing protein n=1 Tax=Lophiostoma macrostomum CBS 122681 TaxID=1314788 RepID=A0A6A6TCF1_9PLEO|nr:hypothetical protein K491DRAFT_321654 [Lophiostoma macrostomum CBS 122681]
MEPRDDDVALFGAYRSRVILGVIITLSITSTASLVLRFVGKRLKRTRVSSEDWVIIAAQIVVYGIAITLILELALGNAGHHMQEQPSKATLMQKLLVPVQCLYAGALCLIKISICLFYSRIFTFRWFYLTSWIIIVITIAWATVMIIFVLAACRPITYIWNPTIANSHCPDDKVSPSAIIGAVNILVEIVLLLLPVSLIWNLQVSLPDKIALFCIFGAGITTMAFGILRTIALTSVDYSDITYTGSYLLLWSFVEPAIGITVACAPLCRPALRRAHHPQRKNKIIELQPLSQEFRWKPSTIRVPPSLLDTHAHRGRSNKYGQEELFYTTQVLESGNWSQASQIRISVEG